jgi:V/A-type H+-transporting ATPase subunit C
MLKLETKKLKLGFYPYTYVRASVMKSLLFKKDDYGRMLKMSFSEIAKFLQESHYRNEINQLATEYSGSDLLELALNRNLANSFKKLLNISHPNLRLLINEYIKRKDIDDIKTILRGKLTGANEKEIKASITSAGTLSYDFLISLLKKESIREILRSNKLVDSSFFKEGIKELNEKRNLVAIENVLDRYYYSRLMQFSGILPKEGALFRSFLLKEVEVLNLLTLFRLKKEKFEKSAAKNFIIPTGQPKDSLIRSLLDVDDLEELSRALEKTEYKDAILKGVDDFKKNSSLITLETNLYKHLLKQSILFMHQHPLTIDVILGYMFAKDIEVRNLKIIVKGKQLGLKEEFIESQLVF